jgi:hypothetical protein
VAGLSDTQTRILEALSRPLRDNGPYASPATNRQIAAEVFLSVDAVKGHLRALYSKFGLESLPQNQKRARLAELVLSEELPVEQSRLRRLRSSRPGLAAALVAAALVALVAVPAGAGLILTGGNDDAKIVPRVQHGAGGERAKARSPGVADEPLPSAAEAVAGSYETVFGTIASEPAVLGPPLIEGGGGPVAPVPRARRRVSVGPPPVQAPRRVRSPGHGPQEPMPPPAPAQAPAPPEPPPQACFDHVHERIHPHVVVRRRVFVHPHVRRRRVSWIHEHVRLHRHRRVRIERTEHIHTWLHEHTRLHVHANGRRHVHRWLHEHSRVHVHEVPRERVRIHRHLKPHEHTRWRREVVRRHRHVEVERERSDHVHQRVHRHCA